MGFLRQHRKLIAGTFTTFLENPPNFIQIVPSPFLRGVLDLEFERCIIIGVCACGGGRRVKPRSSDYPFIDDAGGATPLS